VSTSTADRQAQGAAVTRYRYPPREPAWTVDEACQWFADGGIPIEPGRLRLIIRALRWKPVGESPPGEHGGRGYPLYPIADLMKLHASLAPWLVAQAPRNGPGGPHTDT
jgi:hypothetical protein